MNTIGEISYSNPYSVDGNTLSGATSETMGKNDFLNLLVTQLRYQDPMNPMQDQDFIAQLAQFSQLEQLENMSESLDTATQVDYIMSQTIANTMATTLIGKTVIAEGSDINLSGGQSNNISFNLGAAASEVTIKISNADGTTVRTVTLKNQPAGNNSYTWDGRDDKGKLLDDGSYSYEVTAKNSAGDTITASKRVIGVVDSVKYQDGQAYLIVGGYKISLSTIIEIVNDGNRAFQNNG
ncbi:MAG: flagellar biosynthesis protein FlgD [candidate division Zixibacteria bacterium]|jgi:flagellar basal-body rod modification protein FlgD|nr:flagellar biosynthesis protein FlgD [candidate division Zixibacteria bacterium]